MRKCIICDNREATLPEGDAILRYCTTCWDNRLRQLFREEDRFHVQRVFRGEDSERYFVFHHDYESGNGVVAVIFAMLDTGSGALEISAFLFDKLEWRMPIPFIHEGGVESEVQLLDVFLGVIENDLVPSWPCVTWSAEVSLCVGDPLFIDGRERMPPDEADEVDELDQPDE